METSTRIENYTHGSAVGSGSLIGKVASATTAVLQSPRFQFLACSIADQVMVSGSNLVLNVLLARVLPKSIYGSFGMLFSAFVLFSGFITAFIIEPLSVYGASRHSDRLGTYGNMCLTLHACTCAALIPLIGVFFAITPVPGISFGISIASVAVTLALVGAYWIVRRMAYVSSNYFPAVTAAAIYNLSLVGAVLIALWAGVLSAPGAIVGQAVGALFACAVLVRSLWRHLPRQGGGLTLGVVTGQHWAYGRWAFGTAVVYWLSAEAYYVIVGRIVGAPSVAGFRSVQNLSMLFPNFVTALSLVLLPRIACRYSRGGGAAIRRSVARFSCLCAIAAAMYAAVLWLAGPSLLQAFYGPAYREYAGLLPILCCNLVVIAASQGVQIGLRAMEAPRELFYGFLLAGGFTCTAGIAMTSLWGLTGAIAGLCASTTIFTLFAFFRYSRLTRY
jgi:O-antigen/teichoic acid export membrane protein